MYTANDEYFGHNMFVHLEYLLSDQTHLYRPPSVNREWRQTHPEWDTLQRENRTLAPVKVLWITWKKNCYTTQWLWSGSLSYDPVSPSGSPSSINWATGVSKISIKTAKQNNNCTNEFFSLLHFKFLWFSD